MRRRLRQLALRLAFGGALLPLRADFRPSLFTAFRAVEIICEPNLELLGFALRAFDRHCLGIAAAPVGVRCLARADLEDSLAQIVLTGDFLAEIGRAHV